MENISTTIITDFGTNCKEIIISYVWCWTKLTPNLSECGAVRYIKEHRPVLYTTLLLSGKLNSHLAEIDNRATEMFDRLMKQLAEEEGITEHLKEQDQMAWVQRMNNIRNRAAEIVNKELIYA